MLYQIDCIDKENILAADLINVNYLIEAFYPCECIIFGSLWRYCYIILFLAYSKDFKFSNFIKNFELTIIYIFLENYKYYLNVSLDNRKVSFLVVHINRFCQ